MGLTIRIFVIYYALQKLNNQLIHKILHVPRLSYNLLSLSVATEHRKSVSFEKAGCQVLDKEKPVAVDNKIGEFHYLNCCTKRVISNTAETQIVKN